MGRSPTGPPTGDAGRGVDREGSGDRRQQLHSFSGFARQRPETGKHRLGDGRGHLRGRVSHHLGDEERIATGGRKQDVGVDRCLPGENTHGVPAEASRVETSHPRARQDGQQGSQGVAGTHLLVAIGQHEQPVHLLHATADVAHHVEAGLVGPVDVLHHHDRRVQRMVDQVQHCIEHGDRVAPGHGLGQVTAGPAGDVAQGVQGGEREVVVAPPDVATDVVVERCQPGGDQGRLADPGLASDQHDASLPGAGGFERLVQSGKFLVALQQVSHGSPSDGWPARRPPRGPLSLDPIMPRRPGCRHTCGSAA